ncbi:MAG: heme ABC transporter ATP-binding protein [Bacillota bacterium]
MSVLEVRDLSFSYESNQVLDKINLTVKEGEIFGILGPNGSGKSTLVKLLSRYLKAESGEIYLADKNIKSYQQQQLMTKLAVLPQQQNVGFDFTVQEIVAMGRKPYLKQWQGLTTADQEVIADCLELTNTTQFAQRRINSLSGGEKQRVFLAQTLAQEPEVLLLDEPTSELDINYQLEIFNLIQTLQQQGLTIVVIMHDLNLASQYCNRLALLSQTKIKQIGIPQEVITEEIIKDVYGCSVDVELKSESPVVYLINRQQQKNYTENY